jgi:hypothetical protein
MGAWRTRAWLLLVGILLLLAMVDCAKSKSDINKGFTKIPGKAATRRMDHTPDSTRSLYFALGIVGLFVLPGLIPWTWFTAEPLRPKKND